MRNALFSLSDRTGAAEFARELKALGFEIFTSDGTGRHLTAEGVENKPIAALVGGGPILGHRVVTLSREIHAGLLANKKSEKDLAELKELKIPIIDLVYVSAYPLTQTISTPGVTREAITEATDIGGLGILRSGSKGRRVVIYDPADIPRVLEWLKAGEPDNGFLEELAAKAEAYVASYCMASATSISDGVYEAFIGRRVLTCKYGENAWQTPAHLYSTGSGDPLALDKFVLVEGTDPSYNNLIDVDRLLQTATHIAKGLVKNHFQVGTIAVADKHGNTCGAGISGVSRDERCNAVKMMLRGDPLAVLGALVLLNVEIDVDIAELLAGKLLDGVIAPSITPEAIELLRRKRGKCRFMVNPALADLSLDEAPRFRQVRGGFLQQPNYTFVLDLGDERVLKPAERDLTVERDLVLAWAIGSTSNSNTITLVRSGEQIANAVGQQDRVGSAQLSITRARRSGYHVAGAVAYSDSFFPKKDGPETLADAGVRAILTSSGSLKDDETIELCKKKGVALYMIPDTLGRGFFGH